LLKINFLRALPAFYCMEIAQILSAVERDFEFRKASIRRQLPAGVARFLLYGNCVNSFRRRA